MAWERRQRGTRYYTRTRRVGGKRIREYVGAGLAGELAAQHDARERERRSIETARARLDRERHHATDAAIVALCRDSDRMVRDVLVSLGYHQHKGQWRRRRDAQSEQCANTGTGE